MHENTETIVLMGPIGVGKSTQAELLSQKLERPRCCYDDVKGRYLKQAGFDPKNALSSNGDQSEYGMFCYKNKYRCEILSKIIHDHPGHIIDLGGGTHCFNDPQEIELAKQVLDPIAEIFYLLPSNDLATNINSLPGFKQGYAINTYIMMHPTNAMFAKKIVYTRGKTPEEIMQEIVDQIGKPNKPLYMDKLFNGDK